MNGDAQSFKTSLEQHIKVLFDMLGDLDNDLGLSIETRLANLSPGELNRLSTSFNEVCLIEQDLKARISSALTTITSKDDCKLRENKQAIKRSELAKLLTELIRIHDCESRTETASRSAWVSPSGHTACIRQENTHATYTRPIQSSDEHHRTFYLQFHQITVFKHVDYVWPNLSDVDHCETIYIEPSCYCEITAYLESKKKHLKSYSLLNYRGELASREAAGKTSSVIEEILSRAKTTSESLVCEP